MKCVYQHAKIFCFVSLDLHHQFGSRVCIWSSTDKISGGAVSHLRVLKEALGFLGGFCCCSGSARMSLLFPVHDQENIACVQRFKASTFMICCIEALVWSPAF